MIADLVCNCTRWFKQSSWPTPRFYTVTLLWKLGRIIVPLGKKNKTVQTLILLLVDSVISFPSVATIYRKGETTGQLEIHVDVNSFSSPPTPPPTVFLAAQIIDQPPSEGGNRASEQRGRKFHWSWTKQPHQYCPLTHPFSSFLSPSLSLLSL